ncbi:MAG: type II toxin-antitoxin system Phd/YefM family antitoxin [Candidatus Riflebacteria bacterium]|nr:type II toxin-antitoxin system Phd/YefM family antitoxin [Candidatus Riflebacteria bacterium]
MFKVTVHDAKTHLSRLIRRALDGEDVVIARGKEPLVRLVPIARPKPARIIGDCKGKIRMSDDFDAPLDDFEEYR